jgi:hypothetical protein
MPLSKYHALDQDGLAMPGSKVANGHAWCYKAVPVDTADIAPLSGGEEACKLFFFWKFGGFVAFFNFYFPLGVRDTGKGL